MKLGIRLLFVKFTELAQLLFFNLVFLVIFFLAESAMATRHNLNLNVDHVTADYKARKAAMICLQWIFNKESHFELWLNTDIEIMIHVPAVY